MRGFGFYRRFGVVSSRRWSSAPGWRVRANALAEQARQALEAEKTADAQNLYYAALQTHMKNSEDGFSKEALDLMRHITILHLACFGADHGDVQQLEKARKMQSLTEEALEKIGDWSGLVEALVRRGRQNEALFNQTGTEEHAVAAEEAFQSAVSLVESRGVRGELAVVARLYLAQRISERSDEDEKADSEAMALLQRAAADTREKLDSTEQIEMLATINLAIGRHDMRLARFREAEKVFETTTRLLAPVVDPAHPLSLEAKSLLMHTLLLNDKRDVAVVHAEQLLAMYDCGAPQMADILNMSSVVLFSNGNEQLALDAIAKARILKEANGEDTTSLDDTLKQFEIVKQGEQEQEK